MTVTTETAAERQSHFDELLKTWKARYARYRQEKSDDEEIEEQLFAAWSAAEEAVIQTPAETVSDLRCKAEILWGNASSMPSDTEIAAFLADMRRLTNEPSRTFDAAQWLAWFEHQGGGWIEREGEILLLIPDKAGFENVMWPLNVCDGRNAVFALIRERMATREAA